MGPLGHKRFNIFNISPVLGIFPQKPFNISPVSRPYLHETEEMLKCFLGKVPKTGEMLDMLNMFYRWGEMGPLGPKNLAYLTVPLF